MDRLPKLMHQRVLASILLAILVHPCYAQMRVEYFQRVVQRVLSGNATVLSKMLASWYESHYST